MARSNTESHSNKIERKEDLAKILAHFTGDKLPDQFNPILTVQIPDVDVIAVRVHLKSDIVEKVF